MSDRVELTDLDVITRYSLAVRSATADRSELIEALRADLAWLEGSGKRSAPVAPKVPAKSPPTAPTKAPAKTAKAARRTSAPAKPAARKATARSGRATGR